MRCELGPLPVGNGFPFPTDYQLVGFCNVRGFRGTRWKRLPDGCVVVDAAASLSIISLIIAICMRSEIGTPGIVLCLDGMSLGSGRCDRPQTAVVHVSATPTCAITGGHQLQRYSGSPKSF